MGGRGSQPLKPLPPGAEKGTLVRGEEPGVYEMLGVTMTPWLWEASLRGR